jgi:hypothetical protein
MKRVLSLACIVSPIALLPMTGCAQLPSSAAVVSAMRCPAYPDTQFLDPEKFDITTLTPGGCRPDAVADSAGRSNARMVTGSASKVQYGSGRPSLNSNSSSS